MTTIVNDVSDVGIYNIVADQGTTFIRQIVYKNSAGAAINLGTGATATMKARKSYPATLKTAAYLDPAAIFVGSQNVSTYTSTFTVTIASPAVFTKSDHGFVTNDLVRFTTSGALPTGLTVGTFYYVIRLTANTFNVSLTKNGSAIATTGSQSGTHSVIPAIYSQALTLTPATGIIDIKIPSTTMSAISAGIYDYDLEVTLGTSPGVGASGDVIKIIRGLFEVRQEITY